MNSSSQSQPILAPRGQGNAEPSASADFHVVNHLGVTIATAADEDLAKAACRRLLVRFPENGLSVIKVQTVVTRTVVYRPRLLRSVS